MNNKKIFIILVIVIIIAIVVGIFIFKNQESDNNIPNNNRPIEDVNNKENNENNNPSNEYDFTGTWQRTNTQMRFQGGLIVTEQNEDGFLFQLNVSSSGNSGYMEGFAVIRDDGIASHEVPDEQDLYEEDTYVYFTPVDESTIKISYEGQYEALGLGHNVYVDGEYTKGEPIYTDAGILDEILKTESIKEKLRELVGNDVYYNMVKMAIEYGDHAEYEEGKMFTSFVNGAGIELNLIIEEDEKIYCLIYDVGEYTYYTNDEEKKNDMPQEFRDKMSGTVQ